MSADFWSPSPPLVSQSQCVCMYVSSDVYMSVCLQVPVCELCQVAGGAHTPPEHLLKRICDVERAEWGDFLTAIDDAKAKVGTAAATDQQEGHKLCQYETSPTAYNVCRVRARGRGRTGTTYWRNKFSSV